MYLAGTDRFALAVIVRLAEHECRLRAYAVPRARMFLSVQKHSSAGRTLPRRLSILTSRRASPGRSLAWLQRGFTRSGNAPLRTSDACSNRMLIDNPSPFAVVRIRTQTKAVQAAYL